MTATVIPFPAQTRSQAISELPRGRKLRLGRWLVINHTHFNYVTDAWRRIGYAEGVKEAAMRG